MTQGPDITRGWTVVMLAAIVVVGLLLVQAVPILLNPPLAAGTRSQNQPSGEPAPRVSLQPILDFLPFGAGEAVETAPTLEGAPSVITSDKTLVLQGILLQDDPALSRVILSVDGGAAQGFAVGQTLPGVGTLSRIEAGTIWINHDGQDHILAFPEQPITAGSQDLGVRKPAEPDMQMEGQTPTRSNIDTTPPGLVVTMPAQP
jgi:hypothetical protein